MPAFAWWMVLPAALILFAITLYPLIYSLRISFFRYDLTAGVEPVFIGFENYRRLLFDDARFWGSLWRTLYLVVAGIGIQLVLGTFLASLLARLQRYRALITALVLVPVMMAPVVVAVQGMVVYNAQYGPLNYLLNRMGLPGLVWLGDRSIALQTILLTDVWQWTPFVAIILAAGMSSLPADLYEAAEVDGANRWQMFRRITLPLLQPLIIVVVLLRLMDIFKMFDYVYVLTRGGPGSATETLSYYNYLQGLQFFSFGYAAAMSFVQIIILSVVAALLVRRIRGGFA
ncbi:MAG: sugar ABC transporter permease [Nitriliruptoraceae bacterium]|nr:sugar ABC transporter permease [Nitriliruptoraceae bacterium]